MPVSADDYVMDGALARYAEAERIVITAGQPANYAAVAAATLAAGAVTPGAGNGDFTLADGDVSGRKVSVAAQTGLSISASGDADHVCLVDDTSSRLLGVTTCPTQALTSGGTVDTQAYDIEVADPTAA